MKYVYSNNVVSTYSSPNRWEAGYNAPIYTNRLCGMQMSITVN